MLNPTLTDADRIDIRGDLMTLTPMQWIAIRIEREATIAKLRAQIAYLEAEAQIAAELSLEFPTLDALKAAR